MNDAEFKQWLKERDSVLLTHDIQKFRDFYNKWYGKVYTVKLPDNDLVVKAAMEKAIFNLSEVSEEEKEKAKTWLISNGFTTEI